jgi:hypothetical protein
VECDLVGVAEIAAMLGITRTRVTQLSKANAFPDPVARLAAGPVWRLDDVQHWAREKGRL